MAGRTKKEEMGGVSAGGGGGVVGRGYVSQEFGVEEGLSEK